MRNIWQSLAWKEWHEHKWKLASMLAVIWGMTIAIAIINQAERDKTVYALSISLFLGGIPLAVFIGLGAAAGERSRGTLPFLQSLPVPMWRVALHKLTFSLLTAILPILITTLLIEAVRVVLIGASLDYFYPADQSAWTEIVPWFRNWIFGATCVAIVTSASLTIWAAACGSNRKDEVSAGAVALVLMVVWWCVLVALWLFFLKGSYGPETDRLRVVGVAAAPLGFFMIRNIAHGDAGCLALGYGTFILTHLLLATWYVRRLGRTDDDRVRSPRGDVSDWQLTDFVGQPRRFKLTATVWKQCRESGPVALAGLAAIVAIVACFCVSEWYLEKQWENNIGAVYRITSTIFGFFIAMVAGIGVSLTDVGPRLSTFWRSRPIQPDLWFWTKFATGLIIVMASIYAPVWLIAAAGDTSFNKLEMYPDMFGIAASQIAVFAAAVMATCLVRQAVYAAILSVAIVYVGLVATKGVLMAAGYFGFMDIKAEFWTQPTDVNIAGLLATSVFCAVVAWLAMRNDWGTRSY